MVIEGFVIKFKDTGKVAGTTDIVFGKTLDFYFERADAEFVARNAFAGRPLEIRRAIVEVK